MERNLQFRKIQKGEGERKAKKHMDAFQCILDAFMCFFPTDLKKKGCSCPCLALKYFTTNGVHHLLDCLSSCHLAFSSPLLSHMSRQFKTRSCIPLPSKSILFNSFYISPFICHRQKHGYLIINLALFYQCKLKSSKNSTKNKIISLFQKPFFGARQNKEAVLSYRTSSEIKHPQIQTSTFKSISCTFSDVTRIL